MTNLEKLQTMTVEQLAQFLENESCAMPWCDATLEEINPETYRCARWDCYKCAEAWLMKESEE